jgi:PPOX class probable F420-dependent enzyme
MTTRDEHLTSLASEPTIALTTFRRSGDAVTSPVWVVREGDALLVSTIADTGKVRRLRNNPRVEIRPSSSRGVVRDNAPVAVGAAQIVKDQAEVARVNSLFAKKYGLQHRMASLMTRLRARGPQEAYTLRITLD